MNANLDLITDIVCLIPLNDWRPEEATPLQGFSPSLCERASMVELAVRLPSSIFDLLPEPKEKFLIRRVIGQNPVKWFPQSRRALTSISNPENAPFTFLFLSKNENLARYRQWIDSCAVPPITVGEREGDLRYDGISFETLQQLFLSRLDLVTPYVHPESIERARVLISSWLPGPPCCLTFQIDGHASSKPNVASLSAAGYSEIVSGPFKRITEGRSPYVEQIVVSATRVLSERQSLGDRDIYRSFPPTPDLMIFWPSMYPEALVSRAPESMTVKEKNNYQLVLKALREQTEYSFSVISEREVEAVFGHSSLDGSQAPEPHTLLIVRQQELALCTEAVSAFSASELSAVLRLPGQGIQIRTEVEKLASLRRDADFDCEDSADAEQFWRVQQALRSVVPPEFTRLLERSSSGVRALSNYPLEWVDLNGLPLLLQKNVSRIPVTPGNLFIEQVAAKEVIRLYPEDFREVLVISALDRADPIRPMFERAFEVFGQEWSGRVDVKFVEVASKRELVDALNDFSGALAIFDGHGAHEGESPAKLYLQGADVDVWSLRGQIERVPPIIMLSACDTHAPDQNHATAASGFLALGARSVLGTLFPVSAIDAASLAARLVYRVAAFIPAATSVFQSALTWTEVVCGILRMQALTDVLRGCKEKGFISDTEFSDIHKKGNILINSFVPDAFEQVFELIRQTSGNGSGVEKTISECLAQSNWTYYVNLGRSESIIVDTKDRFESHMGTLPATVYPTVA